MTSVLSFFIMERGGLVVEVDKRRILWYNGHMKKEKELAAHEIEDALDQIVAVIWEAHVNKGIEFLHITVGMHKDGKQVRMSFPKKERK